VRVSDGERFCFLLNFTSEPQAVTFKQSALTFWKSVNLRRTEIPAYGYAWLVAKELLNRSGRFANSSELVWGNRRRSSAQEDNERIERSAGS
jgi:hypothetical protein